MPFLFLTWHVEHAALQLKVLLLHTAATCILGIGHVGMVVTDGSAAPMLRALMCSHVREKVVL